MIIIKIETYGNFDYFFQNKYMFKEGIASGSSNMNNVKGESCGVLSAYFEFTKIKSYGELIENNRILI